MTISSSLSVAPVRRSLKCCGVRSSGPPHEPSGKECNTFLTRSEGFLLLGQWRMVFGEKCPVLIIQHGRFVSRAHNMDRSSEVASFYFSCDC